MSGETWEWRERGIKFHNNSDNSDRVEAYPEESTVLLLFIAYSQIQLASYTPTHLLTVSLQLSPLSHSISRSLDHV